MAPPDDSERPVSKVTDFMGSPSEKPVIVGLYGVSGCGKTHLMKNLEKNLVPSSLLNNQVFGFRYYDGSSIISSVCGGIEEFKTLSKTEKERVRGLAIDKIKEECAENKMCGVVAGHYMFWNNEEEQEGEVVCTQKDLETYTHIIYMEIPPAVINERRRNDNERTREILSDDHLKRWQQAEKTALRQCCREHGILFSTLRHSDDKSMLSKTEQLIVDFAGNNEGMNMLLATGKLSYVLHSPQTEVETMLVFDADRTLCAEDTGTIFWRKLAESALAKPDEEGCPLKKLFGSHMKYSYTAFRQAALLYEEYTNDEEFDALCHDVASEVTMHSRFVSLLKLVLETKHVRAVVVTSGLCRVWEYILEKEGLFHHHYFGCVQVIGGGRLFDGEAAGRTHFRDAIVSADVKAGLVDWLKRYYGLYVWAFGDSPLDLKMLRQADRAIVVVGEENNRSKTMDAALAAEVEKGLKAHQALLPASNTSLRLDSKVLPLVQLTYEGVFKSILGYSGFPVFHATDSSTAKLLMTRTRNAEVAGTALRDAHYRVGMYLAVEFLTRCEVIGLEKVRQRIGRYAVAYSGERQVNRYYFLRRGWGNASYLSQPFTNDSYNFPRTHTTGRRVPKGNEQQASQGTWANLKQFQIPHVQGHPVEGSRLLNEKQTAIIPLMRAGEPMAFGINDAFPLAMFIHAKEPTDLKPRDLEGLNTLVLVDSVVNTGKTLVQFVKHIRKQCPEMHIVFVAGVIQVKAFSSVRKDLGPNEELSLVALRISRNKFPGKGVTDTGNRLFNTTHLD